MKEGLIFVKTSTCKSNPDIEYLDETSDYKLRWKAKDQGIPLNVLKEHNDKIQESVAYLTKEKHGNVFAGGYLRDMILESGSTATEKWDNDKRKKEITSGIQKIIKEHGTYRNAVGHKLVISASEELQETAEKAGLNFEMILTKELKKVMSSFQQEFHPGDRIAYAWGIHHDTDNRHAHIYLANRTEQGKHIAMSCPLNIDKRTESFRNIKRKAGHSEKEIDKMIEKHQAGQGQKKRYEQKDQISFMIKQMRLAEKRIEKIVQKHLIKETEKSLKVEVLETVNQPMKTTPMVNSLLNKVGIIDENQQAKELREELKIEQKELAQRAKELRQLAHETELRQQLLTWLRFN